jgi:hypothetical protein
MGEGKKKGALRKLRERKSPDKIFAFSVKSLSFVATKNEAPDLWTFSINRHISEKQR